MSKNMMKACVAAAMLAVGGTAHADNLTVNVAPAGALQGSVATAVMTVQLEAAYLFDGATFTLDWTGGARELLPLQSSAAGMGYAAVQALFDPAFSSASLDNGAGSLGVSEFFFDPLAGGPGSFDLSLAFKGLQPGTHEVSYYIELVDLSVDPLTRSGSPVCCSRSRRAWRSFGPFMPPTRGK